MNTAKRISLVFALVLCFVSCGSEPTVDSIIISPGSGTVGQVSFTASGQVGSTTVNPLPVGWFVGPFNFAGVPSVNIGWTPTTQPFDPSSAFACGSFNHGQVFLFAAYRPVNLNALSTASMSLADAEGLFGVLDMPGVVPNTTSRNAGWIATVALATCP